MSFYLLKKRMSCVNRTPGRAGIDVECPGSLRKRTSSTPRFSFFNKTRGSFHVQEQSTSQEAPLSKTWTCLKHIGSFFTNTIHWMSHKGQDNREGDVPPLTAYFISRDVSCVQGRSDTTLEGNSSKRRGSSCMNNVELSIVSGENYIKVSSFPDQYFATTSTGKGVSCTAKSLMRNEAFYQNISITDDRFYSKSTNRSDDHVPKNLPNHSHFNVSSYRRTYLTMVIVLVFCFISYLPLTIYSSTIDNDKLYRRPIITNSLEFFALLNSTLNPVIYLLRMRDLRRTVRNILHL